MYSFITGPLLWFAFGVFFLGLLGRVVWYIKGLDWRIDRVAYTYHFGAGIKGALRSILHWLLPFGSRNWRVRPLFTILIFGFHIGVVITPVFLIGHVELIEQRLGISWPTLPGLVADGLTIVVLVGAVCLVLRRIALPEVRVLTTWYDYFLLLLTVLPFLTGFFLVQGIGDAGFWFVVHVLCGEILLVAIPFTKLYHIVGFFLTRMQLGMDYGIKRGGRRGRGIAW